MTLNRFLTVSFQCVCACVRVCVCVCVYVRERESIQSINLISITMVNSSWLFNHIAMESDRLVPTAPDEIKTEMSSSSQTRDNNNNNINRKKNLF